jgi:hypothetical protein
MAYNNKGSSASHASSRGDRLLRPPMGLSPNCSLQAQDLALLHNVPNNGDSSISHASTRWLSQTACLQTRLTTQLLLDYLHRHKTRSHDYISQITITHRLLYPVMAFTVLQCNVFQQWTSSAPGPMSSSAGGHLTPTSYSSNSAISRLVRLSQWSSWYSLGTDHAENTTYNSAPVVAWHHCSHTEVFIAPSPINGWRIWLLSMVWYDVIYCCV